MLLDNPKNQLSVFLKCPYTVARLLRDHPEPTLRSVASWPVQNEPCKRWTKASPLGASWTLVPLGLGRSVLDLDRLGRLHLGVGDLLQLRLRQPLSPLHLELQVSPQLVWQAAVLGL